MILEDVKEMISVAKGIFTLPENSVQDFRFMTGVSWISNIAGHPDRNAPDMGHGFGFFKTGSLGSSLIFCCY